MTVGTLLAVTASSGLHLRAEPEKAAKSLRVLPTGARVVEAEQQRGTPAEWVRVLADGAQGFVAATFVAPVATVLAAPSRSMSQPIAPDRRSSDPLLLHPTFRAKALAVVDALNAEGIPFRLFEAYRAPSRQAYLYAQGRTRPGDIVTKAVPWASYHQYGLAGDFVLFEDSRWSWDAAGHRRAWWDRLWVIGEENGLEALKRFERPHLQLARLEVGDLQAGRFPSGGDSSWLDNLVWQIEAWAGPERAPPSPGERPALSDA
ncbi:SH3 domain-containing protein [Belnapia sp. T6]|uniref:SH3 domain-containing protein n=1 Tax=Belnapia mucosa TaxID=2804532 RepID=A0ABS1VAC6_9PROT|nr:SH3 domain-containing protein [Belnapia mucosa]MBL6458636.1 SH3 domain-containing protein [Belnapia mucosa]